jgi:subtilisin family serine protease
MPKRRRSPKAKPSLLGSKLRTLQPKLRMIANGDATVNTIRAELCAAVKVTNDKLLKKIPLVRGKQPLSETEFHQAFKRKPPKRGHLKVLPSQVMTNVFIHTTTPDALPRKVVKETARRGRIAKASVAITDLPRLAQDQRVRFIELGEPLKAPQPIVSSETIAPPPARRVKTTTAARHKGGKGIIIGIIDVQGFDFSHPDFLDADGNTRFLSIWDQGGDARNPPDSQQFNYGSEFTRKQLNAAIKGAKTAKVPPYELERQSQREPESHGTHVSSIAAGNRGVCPNADIAAVLIDIPPEDMDRRKSFYDSTRLADAVDYLVALARKHKKPISINVSLGTNGHAHDTSSAINRWIDAVVNEPGICVSVAAGNSGQARAQTTDPNDYGWLMGQIHTSGQIPKAGLNLEIEWVVVGNGVLDVSENEFELWYGPQDRFTVDLRPPGMDWLGEIEPGQFIENRRLEDGSFVSIYNELYHPANGANTISIYLSPQLAEPAVIGVRAGTWLIRIRGKEVRDGSFHAWIERDDPQEIGPLGPKALWRFPSFFSDKSNVDSSSVSSLACGDRIVSVANLDEVRGLINRSSSQGPTREGRFKPDVAAPGTDVVAAKGFAGADDLWVAMTGTSMACPYVTGVIGLMLAVQDELTAAQIRGILLRTSRPLAGADYNWRNDAGFGVIHAEDAIKDAIIINKRNDRTMQ